MEQKERLTIAYEDVLELINAAGLEAADAGDADGELALDALRITMEALVASQRPALPHQDPSDD